MRRSFLLSILYVLCMTSANGQTTNAFGYSVASAGDVNNDGYPDLLIGEPVFYNGSRLGRAFLIPGGPGKIDSVQLWIVMYGYATSTEFGRSVSGAGDVNGDGIDDFVVGEGLRNVVYVYFGRTGFDGTGNDTIPDVTMGVGAFEVAGIGDVNADGYDDVIASGDNHAYVFFGGAVMDSVPDLTLAGENSGDAFGWHVSRAGDVNNDGVSDFIVTAKLNDANGTDAGRAYVYFGGLTVDSIPDVVIPGTPGSGETLGTSSAGVGDVNGDGIDDFAIAAKKRGYLFFGGTPTDSIPDVTLARESHFGKTVSGLGDINNDGFADVVVTGVAQEGAAYVFYGGAAMDTLEDVVLRGPVSSYGLGWDAAALGDLNGDGRPDWVLSAPYTPAALNGADRVWVILSGAPDTIFELDGDRNVNRLGITQFDTVYTPPGYPDGDLMATIFQPDHYLARGKAIVVGHGLGDTRLGSIKVWCDSLAAHGYLVMTLDFPEIGASGHYPIPVRAFKTAVEFLRKNAAGFGLDPDSTIVYGLGTSQGAVIWGQAIIWDNDDDFFGTDPAIPDSLNGAILFYGAYDANNIAPQYEALTVEYYSSDPSLRSTKGNCIVNTGNIKTPLLLLHGMADQQVYYSHSKILNDSLSDKLGFCTLVSYGGGHQFDRLWSGGFSEWGLDAKDQVLHWLETGYPLTAVAEAQSEVPDDFILHQNYPNPFNPSTTIHYAIPFRSHVTLTVFNLLGQKVATLVDEVQDAGTRSVSFEGSRLASGVYFYRLEAGSFMKIRKMLLMK